MCARELLLLRASMKDPVITKDLTRAREQAVAPSLSGKICSCDGKMGNLKAFGSFLWSDNVKAG